jgi:signal transduction histidine kinase
MDCSALDERLPAEAELVLYRILQKALNNVERHARAGNNSASDQREA